MAGTLIISTLSDGTNSTSTTNAIQGSAKAWVNFNGTIISGENRRASYNVSSVTRSATGTYTVNFTNAMTDANYSTVGMPGTNINGFVRLGGAPSTGSVTVTTITTQPAAADSDYINIAIFR